MHSKLVRPVTAALAAGALCTLGAAGTARASGFALPEASTAGMATSNAMVANPRELGAIPYNASAMGFHDSSSLALGLLLINPSFSVQTASGDHDSYGAEWFGGPMIQAAIKVADRWRIGLGITAPYGLETRWRYGTFPALSRSATVRLPAPYGPVTIPTGNQPTVSKLEIMDAAPTVAFKVNDNLSLSAGLDIYWARSAQLNSNLGSLDGDGTGVGFNLGFLYRIDAFSVGASFNSGATLGLSGDYTAQNSTMVALRRIAPSQSASLDLDLPWRLQVGLRYEITKDIAAEFDWSYVGWSRFKELVVTGDATGGVISREMNDWSNASAFRLGLTWQVRPTTQLRVGYAYDQTGQGDQFFSARVPDNDRQTFGLGIAQDLGRGFSIEASYMYVMAEQRNFRSATPYTATSGVNGTTALNGDYEMHANLIGIALNMKF